MIKLRWLLVPALSFLDNDFNGEPDLNFTTQSRPQVILQYMDERGRWVDVPYIKQDECI